MIIKLDKYTSAEFREQGISDLNIDIVSAGCAGSKVSVTPRTQDDGRVVTEEYLGIRCWIQPELAEKLDGAQIAKTKGKYYLASKNIHTRCGCGTSFSFEKKRILVDMAKIHRIREFLSQR